MLDQPRVTPCQLEPVEGGWKCAACGRFVRSVSAKPPKAVCRGTRGLGDLVAGGLASVGITKELAQAVASAVGIKDCGCKKRQAAMNAWGAKHLGIGLDASATVTGERDADAGGSPHHD
jgi:hypothetical protein